MYHFQHFAPSVSTDAPTLPKVCFDFNWPGQNEWNLARRVVGGFFMVTLESRPYLNQAPSNIVQTADKFNLKKTISDFVYIWQKLNKENLLFLQYRLPEIDKNGLQFNC
jgi:hypothetical protein